jgi:5-methylcytosine-specific restriction protein B
MTTEFSPQCKEILRLLADRHNVLISGPPGTGKSLLLAEVAAAFQLQAELVATHRPNQPVAVTKSPVAPDEVKRLLPSAKRTDRKVFRTVFHQNSKYRDFLTGLVPVLHSAASGGGTSFEVSKGTLYRANEHAKTESGASLVIIDEINRGPAVQIFGGSIVAFESDKRLGIDNKIRTNTQFFDILTDKGQLEYAISHHVYILAAMNQADSSVEPLDVAFLRRWTPFRLDPSEAVLREKLGLQVAPTKIPDVAISAADVYEAAVAAWKAVNARISLGRGREFQLGHGVLLSGTSVPGTLEGAITKVSEAWRVIRAHVDEVFFGDVRGIAAVLNISGSGGLHELKQEMFANEPRLQIIGPDPVPNSSLYAFLRAVAGQ